MAANLPINFKFDPNSSKYAKSRNRKFKAPKFNTTVSKPTKIYAKTQNNITINLRKSYV